MPKLIDIEPLNQRLEQAGQRLRIESARSVLRLNNGRELVKDDRRNFLRRVGITRHDLWLERIDRIYDSSPQEAQKAIDEVKSAMASIGGKGLWGKHRESLIGQMTGREPHNKGKKMPPELREKMMKIWQSPEHRDKMSQAKMGEKNPMFGKRHSEEYREAQSQRMQQKILRGEFTPNSNNRNTHWDAEYRGKRYRSSWEALYQSHDPAALYEEVRITYQHDGQEKIYIVDFVNHDEKKLIEVKPRELTDDARTQAKIRAARRWAKGQGYEFVLADQEYLSRLPFPDLNDFDSNTQERIRKFYEANQAQQD